MHPFYTAEHEAFRETVRRFVTLEIEPDVATWEEQGQFPRDLYEKAADLGLLGLGFPAEHGGIEADLFFHILAFQELARCGAGGVVSGLMSHTIGLPPVVNGGSEALKARVLPDVLSGRKISALAITEPGCGSDVAAIRTTARRDRDHYIVNGTKTFITSGIRADVLTVAVRTGGDGREGISVLVIDGDTPGLQRTPLKKMGWWCSDTATLYFENCRVPTANLCGAEGAGFALLAQNFNTERISLAASAIAFARVCLEEAVEYARERQTFGHRLIDHQVIRHKLADMAMRINASQAQLEMLAWRARDHQDVVAEICLLKNQASQTLEFCAREGVQIFGGAGYLRGPKVERIYREVRVNAIGGGAEEIMRELAARRLGW
ncbi:MAG TPA: acyl-CoA dehydrogenase family protein [Steroidobacteraceae bacterium]|nr:acyl-CoA dehydrogenase family protein [Steroidobacteraceae bacterium]